MYASIIVLIRLSFIRIAKIAAFGPDYTTDMLSQERPMLLALATFFDTVWVVSFPQGMRTPDCAKKRGQVASTISASLVNAEM